MARDHWDPSADPDGRSRPRAGDEAPWRDPVRRAARRRDQGDRWVPRRDDAADRPDWSSWSGGPAGAPGAGRNGGGSAYGASGRERDPYRDGGGDGARRGADGRGRPPGDGAPDRGLRGRSGGNGAPDRDRRGRAAGAAGDGRGRPPAPGGRGAPPAGPPGGGSPIAPWAGRTRSGDRGAAPSATGGGHDLSARSAPSGRNGRASADDPARRSGAPSNGARGAGGATGLAGAVGATGATRPASSWDDPAPGRADGYGRSADPRRVVVGDPAGGGRGDGPRHARRAGDDLDDEPQPKRKRSWPQRLVLTVGLVLVMCCVLGASVAGYALVKYGSIDRVDDLDSLPSAAEGEPENFLIVAVDTREGQGSRNTDTIMVLRIDPQSDRLALTSFPRDLMVTIADTGETGMINSAFSRDTGGEQNLIDTLKQNFDITINHYVQVNFDSFRQVVDSIGGVPIWMPVAARDKGSGFYNETLGCVNLEGEQGLAFVRSRKLEIMTDGGWEHDPLSDVNRVKRQQIFIQRAMSDALAEVKSNPLRLRQLVDIGVSNIALDPNLGLGDILDLAERFKGFDPAKLETYPLPVAEYAPDPNRLTLDEAGAEPMLNVFRGLAPGEIRPGLVQVQVLNGTQADEAQKRENLASDVSSALQQVGFQMAQADDAETFYPQTTLEYAPGQQAYAERVARHITSAAAIPMVENPELAAGHVRLIAGLDFTTVHQDATPIEAMPVAPGAAAPAAPGPAETPATPPPPETTTSTEQNPFIIGSPPPDAPPC